MPYLLTQADTIRSIPKGGLIVFERQKDFVDKYGTTFGFGPNDPEPNRFSFENVGYSSAVKYNGFDRFWSSPSTKFAGDGVVSSRTIHMLLLPSKTDGYNVHPSFPEINVAPGKVKMERLRSREISEIDHTFLSDKNEYLDYKDFKSVETEVVFEWLIESQIMPTKTYTMEKNVGKSFVQYETWYGSSNGGYSVAYPGETPPNDTQYTYYALNQRIKSINISIRKANLFQPTKEGGIEWADPFGNYVEVATVTIDAKLITLAKDQDLTKGEPGMNDTNIRILDKFGQEHFNGYGRGRLRFRSDGVAKFIKNDNSEVSVNVSWKVGKRLEPETYYYITVDPVKHPKLALDAQRLYSSGKNVETDGYYGYERIWPLHYMTDLRLNSLTNYGTNPHLDPEEFSGEGTAGGAEIRFNKRFTKGEPVKGGWTSNESNPYNLADYKGFHALVPIKRNLDWDDHDLFLDYYFYFDWGYNYPSILEYAGNKFKTNTTFVPAPSYVRGRCGTLDLFSERIRNFAWFRTPYQPTQTQPKLTIPAKKTTGNVKPTVNRLMAEKLEQTSSDPIRYDATLYGMFYYQTIDAYLYQEFNQEQIKWPALAAEMFSILGTIKDPGSLPSKCGFRYKLTTENVWKEHTTHTGLNSRNFNEYVREIPRLRAGGNLPTAVDDLLDEDIDNNRYIRFEYTLKDLVLDKTTEYQIWIETIGGLRHYSEAQKLVQNADIYRIVIGDVKLAGFLPPTSNVNGHWYQIFDSWEYSKLTNPNTTYPVKFLSTVSVKPEEPQNVTPADQRLYNKANGPHYIYYYLNKAFDNSKNYQFKTVVTHLYTGISDESIRNSPEFGMITPWGEKISTKDGRGINVPFVPYKLQDVLTQNSSGLYEPGNPLANQDPFGGGYEQVCFNLYTNTNINAYLKDKYKPEKPTKSIVSTTNPQNPVSFFADNTFIKKTGFGISYFGIYENEWLLQGYGTFTVNTQQGWTEFDKTSVDPEFQEEIPYMDLKSKELFAGKGWHYIDKDKSLVWFDKVGTNDPKGDQLAFHHEVNRNLPAGGNVDDYISDKSVGIEYLINNFAATFVPYQKFNMTFDYFNESSFGITMYVGGQLPYRKSNDQWYITNIDELISLGYVKKLAKLSDYIEQGKKKNVDFVGLEGNQYLFFVADPVIQFTQPGFDVVDDTNIDTTKKLFKVPNGPNFPPYALSNGSFGFATHSVIRLSNFRFSAAYSLENNKIFDSGINWAIPETNIGAYSIRLGTSNNIIPDSPTTEITIRSKAGNGSFNQGIWENGVWNSGWRDDYTVREFDDVRSFYSGQRNTLWRLRLSGPSISANSFAIGDRVSISNIAAIDTNTERRLLKKYHTVVDRGPDFLEVEFEYDFPLSSIQRDSGDHRILVSKNVWLRGVFFNGFFKGIWNDGYFSGYPLITKMDESHWIDGVFTGGHFTARKISSKFYRMIAIDQENTPRVAIDFQSNHRLAKNDIISITYSTAAIVGTLGTTTVLDVVSETRVVCGLLWNPDFIDIDGGTVYTTVSTGLIQNFDFYSNNVSSGTSIESLISERVFSFNTWIDVNYSRQSAVNIGRPEKFNEPSSKRSFSENNLYGYPTTDVVTSKSVFRDSFSKILRRYKLGIRYKIFSDLVGDVSDFKDDFGTTNTEDGLQRFENQGWKLSIKKNQKITISTYDQFYVGNPPTGPLFLQFADSDLAYSWQIGQVLKLSGPYISKITTGTKTETDTELKTGTFSIVEKTTEKLLSGKVILTIKTDLNPVNVTNGNTKEEGIYAVNSTDLRFNIVEIDTSNGLTFSRTKESTTSQSGLVGKELKAQARQLGGILDLTPAYDVANRTNGEPLKVLNSSRYSMVEFDIVDFKSASASTTKSYQDEDLGEIPPIHFNNINAITREKNFGGIKRPVRTLATYLPIYRNINHLDTIGTKKQEFFFNKTNMIMNFLGIGEYGSNETTFLIDNLKMYEIDMVPFFKYFTKTNINRSAVVPNSTELYGQSPIIDYSSSEQSNEDEVLSYFGSLVGTQKQIPLALNWERDYSIFRVQIEDGEPIGALYDQSKNVAIKSI